jgi:hypothetical protein
MGLLTNQYVSESYQGLLNLANPNTGLTSTLQTVTDGLGGNSPLQISQTQVNISGSLTINGSPVAATDTGSLMKTGSVAGSVLTFTKGDGSTFDLSVTSSIPSGTISGSQQIIDLGFLQTSSFNSYTSSNDSKVNSLIASTGSYATTSSLTSLSQSIATTDLGQNNRLSSLETATGSLQNQINQKLDTGSFNSYTSSNDAKVNDLISKTGSYATTGSNNFVGQQNINGSVNVTGSVNITGTVTATSASFTYVTTTYETASVIYSSGSNQFGDAADDTQTLYGTVRLPNGPLSVTGSATISNTLNVQTALTASGLNYPTVDGVTDMFLGTNGAGNLTFDWVKTLHQNIRNRESVTINRGTPLFVSGATGDNADVYIADANNPSRRPATLIAFDATLAPSATGTAIISGEIQGVDTNAYTAGTVVYLASGGGWTSTRPTGSASVQVLGVVTSQANNGRGIVFNQVADSLPNIQAGYVWVGNSDGVPTAVSTGSFIEDLSIYTTTASFNAYTSSNDTKVNDLISKTGSYATTGSNNFVGNQTITGSVTLSGSAQVELDVKGDLINTGSLFVRSGSIYSLSNNTTLNVQNFYTSSDVGQANIIKGWYDNPASGGPLATQANYTGSISVTGSNNIFSLPQARATGFGLGAGLQGYISGSDNVIAANNAGIYMNTSSLLFPKISNNYVGQSSFIGMNFTTSSLSGGHPSISSNTLYGGSMTINHNSGSIGVSTNLINAGALNSTQNFVTNTRPANSGNILGNAATLNHISSSINFNQNLINSPLTINNHLSSSNHTNNSFTFQNNAVFGGSTATGLGVWVSGSQSTNVTRQIADNLIGGKNIIISSSFVSSSNSNLYASLIYGQALIVSASHTTSGTGGSAFLGRYNDTTSLHLAQDIVFAVGTGTSNANRRTGLYVTSGSLVGVSGSLDVKGGTTTITGSVQGNVLPLTVTSNTASLNLNNGNFFELALTGSLDTHIVPSNIKPGQTVNIKLNTTGSGTVSFPSGIVKQVSGSSYVPTTDVSTDIITLVSFDNTTLFLANVKNLI